MIRALTEKWICKYGAPKQILSDQGRQYLAINCKEFMKENKIEALTTTAYNPEGNGISERQNQIIRLACRIKGNLKRTKLEEYIETGINNSYNRVIKATPIELFLKGIVLM